MSSQLIPSSPSEDSAQWYALRVRVKSELVGADELTKRGFDVYAPVRTERKRYSDRTKIGFSAVFPGYVFCHFEMKAKVSVLSAPAVQRIVSFAGTPAPIPNQEIESVRRVIESGGDSVPYVAVGTKVRLRGGSLAGVEGFLLRDDGKDRLVVAIDILQRAVAVTVSKDQLEPVDLPKARAAGAFEGEGNQKFQVELI